MIGLILITKKCVKNTMEPKMSGVNANLKVWRHPHASRRVSATRNVKNPILPKGVLIWVGRGYRDLAKIGGGAALLIRTFFSMLHEARRFVRMFRKGVQMDGSSALQLAVMLKIEVGKHPIDMVSAALGSGSNIHMMGRRTATVQLKLGAGTWAVAMTNVMR